MPEILIVGSAAMGSLESSYGKAFSELGWAVSFWDPVQVTNRYVLGGRLGRMVSSFIRVEPWLMKANRQLVIDVMRLRPRLILTFTHPHLLPGALAQIRAAVDVTLLQIWPDTMSNWGATLSPNLPLYDLVATYSQATVPILKSMGARQVTWLPLAGDPELHPSDTSYRSDLAAEVSFIGGWRPEREAVLSQLQNFDLKIWGPEWGRRCRNNQAITKAWEGRALRGVEFAQAVQGSKINLNIIDPTNYPAANMRFFEIPTAGGLQVCSSCHEMEAEFRHGEQIFYFHNQAELPELLRALLSDEALRTKVATAAHAEVLARHTYTHRAQRLLELLDIEL
jgi:spore maturation protein CgeB